MVVSLSFLVELEFGNVSFEERGKPLYRAENLSEQRRESTTKNNAVVHSMMMMTTTMMTMMIMMVMIRIHVESKVNKLYDESESLLRILI